MLSNASAPERTIRVFISSTFRDMHAERDHLVTVIFPQLRRLCEARGVTWGEVDLRWGVTDEAAAEGQVLPICLEEIRRCRPYFVSLLGERYGWVPRSIPDELLEREAWLREQFTERKSVTELEILYGVLRNPVMAGHAFFYFRDPAYAHSVPEKDRKDFTAESAEDADKLRDLKETIRRSGLPVRDGYRNPKVLGRALRRDLRRVIDRLFPEGSQPDALTREVLDHAAYARSRARTYIGRPKSFARLDAHADGGGDQPLVVLGESGSGKSALLANWAARYRQVHPDAFVLEHYVSATPSSADWAAMLRRIMGEFKQRLGLTQEIPDRPDALRSAFPGWLHMAAAKCRIVLILDALNQLEDRDGAPDLLWLPPVMPDDVRLIVSTLPSRALDEIGKRGWPVFTVEPFSVTERKEFIRLFLHDYGRGLSPSRIDRIAAAPPSANPLYLRVLLDELRLFGQHERLEERIDYYLEAAAPYELYGKVIARWEENYGGGTDLVGDTLSLLWAARRGLTESELLNAMGRDGQPLPGAVWSPLFLGMSDALVNRSGLLTFVHDFLRTAARDAYLPTESDQQQAHIRLARYFDLQPLVQNDESQSWLAVNKTTASPFMRRLQESVESLQSRDYDIRVQRQNRRKLDELPWQLAQAEAWDLLYQYLSNATLFEAAHHHNRFDVHHYWSSLERSSKYQLTNAYETLIADPTGMLEYGPPLADLLCDFGYQASGLHLYQLLADNVQGDRDDSRNKLEILGNCAIALQASGDLEGAMRMFQELERALRAVDHPFGLARCLGNQATNLMRDGRSEEALGLLKQQETISRELSDRDGLSRCLSNQAIILAKNGATDTAMTVWVESERICRELGNMDILAGCLLNQARLFLGNGDTERATSRLQEAESISSRLNLHEALLSCFRLRAETHRARGETDAAMDNLLKEQDLCKRRGNNDDLVLSLSEHGKLLIAKSDFDGAKRIHQQQVELCKQMKGKYGLSEFFGKAHISLANRETLRSAIDLLETTEKICRATGDIEGVVLSLGNQAWMRFCTLDDQVGALPLTIEALELATKHGMSAQLEQLKPIAEHIAFAPRPRLPGNLRWKVPAFWAGVIFGGWFGWVGSNTDGRPVWMIVCVVVAGAMATGVIVMGLSSKLLGRMVAGSEISRHRRLYATLLAAFATPIGGYCALNAWSVLFVPYLSSFVWGSFWGLAFSFLAGMFYSASRRG